MRKDQIKIDKKITVILDFFQSSRDPYEGEIIDILYEWF